MGVIRNIKKAVIKRLKLIYKHYRYKIYFPRLYREACKDNPVHENKILFLEMRFDGLSNSMEYMYNVMEKSGKYELATAHLHFNFSRGHEFTENVRHMIRELANSRCVILDEASIVLSCLPLRNISKRKREFWKRTC